MYQIARRNSLASDHRKTALKFAQSFGECAWMARIMLFEQQMVWDVVPIIFFYHTTQKEKVFLPLPHNNREDVQSTASETCKSCTPSPIAMPNQQLLVWFWHQSSFFFFFWFQRKATRAGDEKHRKKSTWPYGILRRNCSVQLMCYTSTFWKCIWFDDMGSVTKVMSVEVKYVTCRFCPFFLWIGRTTCRMNRCRFLSLATQE